jgi:hypothetical protein
MTEEEYGFLQGFAEVVKHLRNGTENQRKRFDRMNIIDEFLSFSIQEIKDLNIRVEEIRNMVLQKTNGIVTLPDEIIIAIIEKSVL